MADAGLPPSSGCTPIGKADVLMPAPGTCCMQSLASKALDEAASKLSKARALLRPRRLPPPCERDRMKVQ